MAAFEIDLSSDTATRPTPAMRRFMCRAEVGDEQRGEDPTVLELEETVAALLGKEAAVFLPSGTMCNVVALFTQCRPGDEVILHRDSHAVYSENAGPAVHSRVSLQVLDGDGGLFSGADVLGAMQPIGRQKPRSRLVAVENTNNRGGGTVWPLELIDDVCAAAEAGGLVAHLDGARLLNAVVESGVPADRLCSGFDSAWIDLSKGLGCPMGAVLAGSAVFVEEARRAKHLFGGALRQAGIVAAAGIYALRHHVDRLADDHELARRFAAGVADMPGVELAQTRVDTNIVTFDVSGAGVAPADLLRRLEPAGVRFSVVQESVLRAVTHLDIRPRHVPRALGALRQAIGRS